MLNYSFFFRDNALEQENYSRNDSKDKIKQICHLVFILTWRNKWVSTCSPDEWCNIREHGKICSVALPRCEWRPPMQKLAVVKKIVFLFLVESFLRKCWIHLVHFKLANIRLFWILQFAYILGHILFHFGLQVVRQHWCLRCTKPTFSHILCIGAKFRCHLWIVKGICGISLILGFSLVFPLYLIYIVNTHAIFITRYQSKCSNSSL